MLVKGALRQWCPQVVVIALANTPGLSKTRARHTGFYNASAPGLGCVMIMKMRIAVLIKQVPVVEALALRPDGRLQREHLELEMNPFCRRAVAQGVTLAQATGGSCTAITLGPYPASEVLREAVAWGADFGLHITGPEFAGSDTLATARALTAALQKSGPYDLVLVGRNSVDADTGQVGPAVAQFLDLPFLGAARALEVTGDIARARLEHDDGWVLAEAQLPAVVACAERLCPPCKMPPAARAAVPGGRIRSMGAADLGPGPWGEAGSATAVGAVRLLEMSRRRRKLSGSLSHQVNQAVELLQEMGALGPTSGPTLSEEATVPPPRHRADETPGEETRLSPKLAAPLVAVLMEPERPELAREMLGEAAQLAAAVGGTVTAVASEPAACEFVGSWGADELLQLDGGRVEEDIARALGGWCASVSPWAILAPGTMWGREVAARVAVMLEAGLTGDAVELGVDHGRLTAWKPAFGGRLVAAVTATSDVQLATVRPGTRPLLVPRAHKALLTHLSVAARHRVRILDGGREDDLAALSKAPVVIGVGSGVVPEHYAALGPLLEVLGAELAGTRRVTDRGWLPRCRQLGLTGLSIRPRLYVAVGLSGKFNHMVGVQAARCVLAINSDPAAPVFDAADIGLVGDWQEAVPLLVTELTRAALQEGAVAPRPVPQAFPA